MHLTDGSSVSVDGKTMNAVHGWDSVHYARYIYLPSREEMDADYQFEYLNNDGDIHKETVSLR